MSWDTADRIDAVVRDWAADHRPPASEAAAHLLSSAADRSKLWAGVALVRWMFDRATGRQAALRAIAAVALQSALIHVVVKRIWRRPRPPTDIALRFGARRPPSTAFPSGHAASAAAAAILLADGMPGWLPATSALALGIGWSRVQVGLHHATDVAAGFVFGTAFGLVARRAIPLTLRRR